MTLNSWVAFFVHAWVTMIQKISILWVKIYSLNTAFFRCEIEEYLVGRDRGDGRKDTGTMQVKIDNSTTTTTTTTTTTSATASSTPPSTTTSSTTGESSSTTSKQDAVPDAVPRTDDSDSASSNTSTVVAIIVIIIIVSCVGGSAYYYRRRQKKRPDAAAAVVYDREFRQSHDTANMMRSNSQTGVNTGSSADLSIRDLHRDDPDNRQHLHEFFPHSDSFAWFSYSLIYQYSVVIIISSTINISLHYIILFVIVKSMFFVSSCASKSCDLRATLLTTSRCRLRWSW